MDFTLLGSVEVHADGTLVRLGRRQERCLLGLLLLEAGHFVSHDRLADMLWDADPPDGARAALQTYVARLRAALAAHGITIASGPAGYRVDVEPLMVDAHRFRAAVAAARTDADPATKAERLGGALALWRGPLMVGVATDTLRARIGVEFEELRLEAVTMLAEAETVRGHADRAVDLLRPEVAADPLREVLVGQLMTAYRAAGRQSAAVTLYHDTRSQLIEALGLEPGPALRARYAELLGTDATAPGATGHAAQLPAGVHRFCGRTGELERLDVLAGEQGAAVVISALSGLAGIGKTALALHWAHRTRDRFPDGQLYVDLRGFDPRTAPLDPADALRGFLDALGVRQPPPDRDALAARYRSAVVDRQMLVVLDNARDADQVRDLLPAAAGCVTLITSRRPMIALVALSGAQVLVVDRLPDADARALLASHVDAGRLAAEPAAVEELLRRCAGLPLALAIVAAQLATDPAATVAGLAKQLATDTPLAALDTGEPAADVRTVFSLSYRSLRAPAAEAFRRLGMHPVPAFDAYAAASLLAVPVAAAERTLAELAMANLVAPTAPGRYAMHDLVHAYAAELAGHDDDDVRAAVWTRITDHYTHTGAAADKLIDPSREPHTPEPPAPGVSTVPLGAIEDAMTWYTAVKPVMMTLLEQATDRGADDVTWHMGSVMSSYLDRAANWDDLEMIQLRTLAFAERTDRPSVAKAAHHSIARSQIRRGRLNDAIAHLLDALPLVDRSRRPDDGATMHNELATLYAARGDNVTALFHVQQSLALLAGTRDRALLARTLNGVGWFHAQLGEYAEALAACTEAAGILREEGDVFGEADTVDSLGFILHAQGDHAGARARFQEAYELFQRTGDGLQMALVLDHRGDAESAGGDVAAARVSWCASAELFEQVGRPEAEAVRAKLADN